MHLRNNRKLSGKVLLFKLSFAEREKKIISLLTGKLLKLHFEWHTEHIPDVADITEFLSPLPLNGPRSKEKWKKFLGFLLGKREAMFPFEIHVENFNVCWSFPTLSICLESRKSISNGSRMCAHTDMKLKLINNCCKTGKFFNKLAEPFSLKLSSYSTNVPRSTKWIPFKPSQQTSEIKSKNKQIKISWGEKFMKISNHADAIWWKSLGNVFNQVNELVISKTNFMKEKNVRGYRNRFWSNAQVKSKWNSTNFQHSEKKGKFLPFRHHYSFLKSHNENWKSFTKATGTSSSSAFF